MGAIFYGGRVLLGGIPYFFLLTVNAVSRRSR